MAETVETDVKDTQYFLNEATGRYLKVGSPTYKRLMKKMHSVKPPSTRDNVRVEEVQPENVLQHRLMEESTEMVKENLDTLGNIENLSQKELDRLLKRMLMDKLNLSEKKSKKSKKSKRKKKPRFKVKTPPSSSSEESDGSD